MSGRGSKRVQIFWIDTFKWKSMIKCHMFPKVLDEFLVEASWISQFHMQKKNVMPLLSPLSTSAVVKRKRLAPGTSTSSSSKLKRSGVSRDSHRVANSTINDTWASLWIGGNKLEWRYRERKLDPQTLLRSWLTPTQDAPLPGIQDFTCTMKRIWTAGIDRLDHTQPFSRLQNLTCRRCIDCPGWGK